MHYLSDSAEELEEAQVEAEIEAPNAVVTDDKEPSLENEAGSSQTPKKHKRKAKSRPFLFARKMSMDKFRTLIELLRLRADSNERKVKFIDEEIEQEISKKAEGFLRDNTIKLWKEECENEEISSLQRWEKKNPFFKKIENKSYAQAARQAPNRKTNKQTKYQNKYVNVEKVRPENTYNNRNRSSSTSRRNNFQNQQNQRNRFMQGNRNHSPTNNFRQNHQQRSQRYEQSNSNYKRNDESTESQNNNRNPYQRNRNSRERFLEPGERNRDTRKGLTDKECDYLTNFKCKSSNFYGLPKIHKSNVIRESCKNSKSECVNIPHPNDLKLRPIVAGPSCETHRLSNFLDILLKPILKHIPSFVRDDLDMLNHLPRTVCKDSIMVSFDVVNLYTTIPHEYGLTAIEFWLEKFPSEVPDRIEKKFIIEGIKFILQNNYFNFNGESYRQISGTAMGTKVAPTYANLWSSLMNVNDIGSLEP
ncbi:unnamed protein product [Mytilus edulis]|uniref:Reverse transcriptase domain-containing protein n=1 Tax=Mytilus edulis TaxID=6550 RepID=A0A8S3RTY3_MYTED|nr:unnamed protein product [Mytilus edulis]